ncbi:MAG: hypothetical protein U9Q97_00370 [Acidobacteriota bacterium]|nr:hypothetical protein [Acidobacteriota bacterium]
MTSELERIKILESKISQVVDYINNIVAENTKLKQQLKELRLEKKDLSEQAKKIEKLNMSVTQYEKEREAVKEKIETIINQISKIGI